jgi:hypothetical protein
LDVRDFGIPKIALLGERNIMATIFEYFNSDFSYAAKIGGRICGPGAADVDVKLHVDFAAGSTYFSCFVPDDDKSLSYFVELMRCFEYGKTQVQFSGTIWLPSARQFPGKIQVDSRNGLEVMASFFGDPSWISLENCSASRRALIYTNTILSEPEILKLMEESRKFGHEVLFRSPLHAQERSKHEKPLAFVSYDSRDREVASKIAEQLQKWMCPVWYDEYSLKVGDNLRDKIEDGLKNCKRCILILSANFFANKGWTKREFDSIFTREILEQKGLVLPVWVGVSKEEVYGYSPSLLNVVGVSWDLGDEEVSRRLHQVIVAE